MSNKNNNQVNIRFVGKTSNIRKLAENITADVMLKYQKWVSMIPKPQQVIQSIKRLGL